MTLAAEAPAGDLWMQAKAWLGFFGVLGFFLYPVFLLAWNFVEGRAAASPIAASKGDDVASEKAKHHAPAGSRKIGGEFEIAYAGTIARAIALGNVLRYIAVAVVLAIRLVIFSVMLGPWFLKIGYAYRTNKHMLKGIRFGSQPRNYVDIYLPGDSFATAQEDTSVPVVIVVMGGAWVIGYRMWSALLATRLAETGVMVVAVDYRNFPGAEMPEMIDDVERAIGWVFANIEHYGGDPTNVALIGQSAGAHLSIMALLQRCQAKSKADAAPSGGDATTATEGNSVVGAEAAAWSPRQLRGFVGVSGVYDLPGLEAHLHRRGVYPFLHRACPGKNLEAYSPVHQLLEVSDVAKRLPPVTLFHGEADNSAPVEGALRLERVLRAAGIQSVAIEVRPGMCHTEPVVEDPFTGGDMQAELVLPLVLGEAETKRRLSALPPCYPSAPRRVVRVASPVMPF